MKAVLCEGYGGVEVLRIATMDKPNIKADELLIRIYATTVNSGDVAVRSLKGNHVQKIFMKLIFGWNKLRNPILGTNYAGIVEQIGSDVNSFEIGDEVFGLRGFKFGTHAEYVAIKEDSVVEHKPINATFVEAAALLFGGQTAHYFIHKSSIPKISGLKIMVYGATSSVGTAAIQIAKYYGAEVTAVCSDYSEDLVLKLGADKVIFYNKSDFTQTDEKYHVVFDAVGKISRKQIESLLLDSGQFYSVAGLDYAKETKFQLMFLKEIFETGIYNPCIDRIYTIDEIAEAHRYVDTGKKKGNVVVQVNT
ncbi:MAG: NAD(P)-dependent alcohol dehydrogenase [Cyclobacteriaceae bacterium]|nr:NAD(P)-dependent alcohol dehydrogenase [Cyclobacteriaceae bacterium]MCH8518048.1 NAD(P)-dependent alcohol dehydrogenase [Cyclobacteriaceae bacterium]